MAYTYIYEESRSAFQDALDAAHAQNLQVVHIWIGPGLAAFWAMLLPCD